MHPHYASTGRTWEGYLTLANAEAVRDRMVRDFGGGKTFTSCVANEFFSFRPEVFPACVFRAEWTDRSADEVRLTRSPLDTDGPEMAHLMWSAGDYSWGIHTTDSDQGGAASQRERYRTWLKFEHRHGGWQLLIEHYTPAGSRLYWTLATGEANR
jgi:hypothetical protein